jgi:pimeloyl-ACP methyl ester carboxylesterase
MGGFVAQKLAEADAVTGTVLLCSAPPKGISVLGLSVLPRQIKYLAPITFSRPLLPNQSDANALVLNRVPLDERAPLFSRMVPESGRVGREFSLGRHAVDARRVRSPVLTISAAEDRLIAPRIGRALNRKYGGTFRLFGGHAHYLLAEPGWQEIANEVIRWITTETRG